MSGYVVSVFGPLIFVVTQVCSFRMQDGGNEYINLLDLGCTIIRTMKMWTWEWNWNVVECLVTEMHVTVAHVKKWG